VTGSDRPTPQLIDAQCPDPADVLDRPLRSVVHRSPATFELTSDPWCGAGRRHNRGNRTWRGRLFLLTPRKCLNSASDNRRGRRVLFALDSAVSPPRAGLVGEIRMPRLDQAHELRHRTIHSQLHSQTTSSRRRTPMDAPGSAIHANVEDIATPHEVFLAAHAFKSEIVSATCHRPYRDQAHLRQECARLFMPVLPRSAAAYGTPTRS